MMTHEFEEEIMREMREIGRELRKANKLKALELTHGQYVDEGDVAEIMETCR